MDLSKDSGFSSSRLISILATKGDDIEVELAFGNFESSTDKRGKTIQKFVPGITGQRFNALQKILRLGINVEISTALQKSLATSKLHISPLIPFSHTKVFFGQENTRKIVYYDLNTGVLLKETRGTKQRDYSFFIENREWGYRIYTSVEKNQKIEDSVFTRDFFREKVTFISETPSFKIFLSIVSQKNLFFPIYDVEIERKDFIDIKENHEKNIHMELQSIYEVLMKIMNDNFQNISLFEKKTVIYQINDLFNVRNDKYIVTTTPKSEKQGLSWAKPIDIKTKALMEEPLAVTVKYDGERKFIYFGDNGVYMFFPGSDVVKIHSPIKAFEGTILDGEFMLGKIFCFDILFRNYKDVRSEPLIQRYNLVREIFEGLKTITRGFEMLYLKKIYLSENVYENIQTAYKEFNTILLHDKNFLVDGLILQEMKGYISSKFYKWKPQQNSTIDFTLKQIEGENMKAQVMIYENKSYIPFTHNGSPLFATFSDPFQLLSVVECSWDESKQMFICLKSRFDKTHPNGLTQAKQIFSSNFISRDTLLGQDNTLMRKQHNMKKFDILSKYAKRESTTGMIMLDIGSGRGGDLSKWKDVGLRKVYALEPNPRNADEFEKRWKEMEKEKIPEIILMRDTFQGFPLTEKTKQQFDIISSFFSLTFFFRNKELFDNLINSIDYLLKDHGVFIGITMEGTLLRKEFSEEKITEDSFQITKVSGDISEDFGCEIAIDLYDKGSMVKNQIEWLVNFEILKQELSKKGIVLQEEGEIETFGLPKSSHRLNSYMKHFCFVKTKTGMKKSLSLKSKNELEKIKVLLEDKIESIPEEYLDLDISLENLQPKQVFSTDLSFGEKNKQVFAGKEFIICGNIKGKDSLLSACLILTSSKYEAMDVKRCEKVVHRMRKTLYESSVELKKKNKEILDQSTDINLTYIEVLEFAFSANIFIYDKNFSEVRVGETKYEITFKIVQDSNSFFPLK